MPFIFKNRMTDTIRNRTLMQRIGDKANNKKRGDNAPKELKNITEVGITPNGTYFLCSLVYKTNLPNYQKISIFSLIDAYANAENNTKRLELKQQIQQACGDQVEGIALLFSKSKDMYGFVTGNRVKVGFGQYSLALDNNNQFAFVYEGPSSIAHYIVFILTEEQSENASNDIANYLLQDQIGHPDDEINTDSINAIKHVRYLSIPTSPSDDINLYLKSACDAIQDPTLKTLANTMCDTLQTLPYNSNDISIALLQLLHAKNDQERKQHMIEYSKHVSTLYGSKMPTTMLLGAGLCLLGIGLLTLACLYISGPMLYLCIIATAIEILGSFIAAVMGEFKFYNTQSIERRTAANTLFSFHRGFNQAPYDLMPTKIVEQEQIKPNRF